MLNFPAFVSSRLQKTRTESFSTTVYRIGVGSIALGLVVMITSLAVLSGFKYKVQQKLFTLAAHVRVTKFSINQSYEETPLSTHSRLFEHYRSIEQVAHLQGVAHKPAILKTKQELQGVVLKGVGTDFDWANFKQDLVAGKLLTPTDSGYASQLLISSNIAQKLNLRVGDEVVLWFLQQPPRPRKLRIQGIYMTGLEEFDNQLVIGDLSLIQRLNGWAKDTVGVYELFVKDFAQLDQATAAIENMLAPDMDIEKVTDRHRPLFDWLVLLDRNMVVFLVLIFFVCSFNMTSILLVMMMERTPMIGLFKALGSTNWQIRKVFLYLGVQMIVRGLFWGNLLGLGLCWVQRQFKLIPLDPSNYFMDSVPIEFDWAAILGLNIGTLLLVTAVLVIPTVVITRVQPVQAIVFNK